MNNQEIIYKIRSVIGTAYNDSIARFYLDLFGHEVFERFAIVGYARTGSNFLLSGLKSSRSIRAYHEIFADHNREKGKDFERILSQVYQKESKRIKAVGFKLFYNHLTKDEWEKFIALKNFKIIHLTRANRLRTIVSLDIAFKTKQWTRSAISGRLQAGEDDKKITLDTSTLISRLESIEEYEEEISDYFRDRFILEIVYEKLVTESDKVFRSIGNYLNVHDINPNKIKLKKQNPEELNKLIINFDEVSQLLRKTKYASYLNESL